MLKVILKSTKLVGVGGLALQSQEEWVPCLPVVTGAVGG